MPRRSTWPRSTSWSTTARSTAAAPGSTRSSARRTQTRHDRLEEIGRDRFIVGSPETAIKAIRNFQEQLGIDHLICRLFFPGMPHDHIMSEIKLLAEEVIPAFR